MPPEIFAALYLILIYFWIARRGGFQTRPYLFSLDIRLTSNQCRFRYYFLRTNVIIKTELSLMGIPWTRRSTNFISI